MSSNSENKPVRYSAKKTIKILLLAFLFIILIKSFFLSAYEVPTSSMKNALYDGDFILVSTASYNIATPNRLPFTSVRLPVINLIPLSDPERNDIVVLEMPAVLFNEGSEEVTNYVKRVIGLPGETVSLTKGNVHVNDNLLKEAGSVRQPNQLSADHLITDTDIFPSKENQNRNNYGPYYIPKKGDTIEVSPNNISDWHYLINRDLNKKSVSVEGTVITIEGKPVNQYVYKNNFYFLLGDNRENSIDSRYWGLIPESVILGKAIMVYFSKSKSGKIRFNRLLNIID